MKSMTQEVAELRALTVSELAARYTTLFGRAPRVRHHAWLWKRVAWRIQADCTGGLSKVAQKRLEELIIEIDFPGSPVAPAAPPSNSTRPTPGTVLTREWRGREIRVQVLDQGFEFEGIVYRSLSAVAKAATGGHWSGALFFGLRGRRTKAS